MSKATLLMPRKSSADRGGYIELLLLVSDEADLPSFDDKQFNPVVVPVMPLNPQQQQQQPQRQQQQLGPAGDMMRLLAQHKAQFIVSVGDRGDYGFLEQLPAQVGGGGACVCVERRPGARGQGLCLLVQPRSGG
jgi:hypothetical protein